MTSRIIIKGCTVLSMDEAVGNPLGMDILVEDDTIAAVGPCLRVEDATVVDGTGTIAMPGLVNAHIHTWQFQLRGIGADWLVKDYFQHMHSNIATCYRADDIYIGTLMGAINQLRSGTTTIVDWSHALHGPDMADASIDALEEAGIRAVFVRGTAKPPERPGERPFYKVPYPREEVQRLRCGRLASDDRLVTLAMGILGPDIGEYDVAVQDIRLAREIGLRHSAHAFGRQGDRRTEKGYARLAGEGLLGPDHNIAHGNCLDDDELKKIIDTGCTITATTVAEMLVTERPSLLGRVIRNGGEPSLGSDVEAHFNGAMLAVARHAFMHQREYDNRSLHVLGEWPPRIAHATMARDALYWATMGGAKAFGLDSKVGSISPGKQADLILVDVTAMNIYPAGLDGDPALAVLMYAETSDIRDVMVAGQFHKRNGKMLLPDSTMRTRLEEVARSRRRLFENASFAPGPIEHGSQPALFV